MIIVNAGGNTLIEVAGTQGPQGPPGTGASVHNQVSPASTWTFSHSLGRLPAVSVYDSSGNLLLADVEATSSTISVTFASPTSGSVVFS